MNIFERAFSGMPISPNDYGFAPLRNCISRAFELIFNLNALTFGSNESKNIINELFSEPLDVITRLMKE